MIDVAELSLVERRIAAAGLDETTVRALVQRQAALMTSAQQANSEL